MERNGKANNCNLSVKRKQEVRYPSLWMSWWHLVFIRRLLHLHKWCQNISPDSLSIRNLPFQHFESHTFGYWSGRSIEVSSIWVNCHALSFWAAEQSNRERSLVLDFPLQPACLNTFETFKEILLRLSTKYFWDFQQSIFETFNEILLCLSTKWFWDF